MDVGLGYPVVEEAFPLVGEVTQSVPLRGYLRVEGPDVVVYYARVFAD